MASGQALNSEQVMAARAFVRSLNILLKSARLYGFEHERTTGQLEAAWSELHAAFPDEHGLLLGASGSQLLLDGVPLETAPVERSFATLLSTAGLASIHFSSRMTKDDFSCFVRAFAAAGAKPAALAEKLHEALKKNGEATIRVNEVRFVAEDAGVADARAAAQLTARTLGADADNIQAWLNDPQKLLQLIAAAEGAHAQPAVAGAASSEGTEVQASPAQEADVQSLMHLLTRLGKSGHEAAASPDPEQFQQDLARLPAPAQVTLQQVLAQIAADAPAEQSDTPLLMQVAEHLAIRFALERYQRGEVQVNAVRELLDHMSQDMENLRSVLSAHEEKMSRAGLAYESHADILDREFWSAVPESGKRSVLLSHEAWCIPHRNLEQFLRQLLKQGDHETADAILLNYASCLHNPDREARRRTAIGLTELAGLYAGEDSRLIEAAIRHAGRQLGRESDPELQTLTSAAFVRLSQEATTHHHYGALEQTLAALENVAQVQPSLAHSVRPRIGVENRLPELIEEALQVAHVPEALLAVLQRVREPTTLQLAQQLSRCERREERERVVQLAKDLGTEATAHLSETLRTRPASEAAVTAGLLSRLDSPALEETLPQRLRGWNRHYHDVVVRLIAAGGALNRGHVLLKLVDVLDHSVLPMALDEIGMCGDVTATLPLMRLAGGELLQSGEPYLRIKAVEALGRLREPTATPLLRRLVEAKQVWRWVHPRELRLVAAQALLHIDPEWAQACLPRSGLPADELAVAPLDPVPDDPWVRQRRYPRHSLPRTLAGTANCPRGDSQLTVKVLSLGGGLAASERPLPPGTEAKVTLHYGLRHLNANTLVRAMRSHQVGFEISEIDLAERTKLRRLLTGLRPV